MHIELLHPDLFLIHGVLTTTRCQALIEHAESAGFEPAPVTTATGPRMLPQVRDNTRVMEDDHALAGELFALIAPMLPEHWKVYEGRDGEEARACVGLNERLRYYRYAPGQRFKMHRDGRFERGNGEASKLTVLFYLNDDFTGGHTQVLTSTGAFDVHPCQGSALLFKHELRHEGEAIIEGLKYVLRSDVMYARGEASPPS